MWAGKSKLSRWGVEKEVMEKMVEEVGQGMR